MESQSYQQTGRAEIAIMEDDRKTKRILRTSLREIGFMVYLGNNSDELLRISRERHVRIFILDINMGTGRQQEGLDALEKIKHQDPESYVAILSAYPNRYRNMANKLRVDYFLEKTANTQEDVRFIYEDYKSKTDPTSTSGFDTHPSSEFVLSDDDEPSLDYYQDHNQQRYLELISDEGWYKENKDKYVGIVDGKVVLIEENWKKFVTKINKLFPNKPKFVQQILKLDEIIDLPSPIEIK